MQHAMADIGYGWIASQCERLGGGVGFGPRLDGGADGLCRNAGLAATWEGRNCRPPRCKLVGRRAEPTSIEANVGRLNALKPSFQVYPQKIM